MLVFVCRTKSPASCDRTVIEHLKGWGRLAGRCPSVLRRSGITEMVRTWPRHRWRMALEFALHCHFYPLLWQSWTPITKIPRQPKLWHPPCTYLRKCFHNHQCHGGSERDRRDIVPASKTKCQDGRVIIQLTLCSEISLWVERERIRVHSFIVCHGPKVGFKYTPSRPILNTHQTLGVIEAPGRALDDGACW